MKRAIFTIIALLAICAAKAQTIYVCQGNSYTTYSADAVGNMTYSNDGQTLTILGTAYNVNEIDSIVFTEPSFDTTEQSDTVYVVYDGTSATVTYNNDSVSHTIDGANVTVTSTTYKYHPIVCVLSGTSTDGSFVFNGSCQSVLILNGLTLTSSTGAAISVATGKKTTVIVPDGTTTTLTDAADGSQKACLYTTGNFKFSDGTGTLNVIGNTKHAISAKEEIEIKKSAGTINVTSAVSDGIHCNDYFQMNGGTVTISGTGGDGIDSDDEGLVIIKGGTINITVSTEDNKGIKSDSTLTISGGDITLNVGTAYSHGIKCGTGSTISGGTITETVTGTGAKGIKAASDLTISGGTINITNSGTCVIADGDTTKAVCIKGDADLLFTGGTITLKATGNGGKCINTSGGITFGTYTSTALADIDKTSLVINCTTTGSTWSSGSSSSSQRGPGGMESSDDGVKAKTIRAEGDIVINNGYIYCKTSTDGSEGIESKSAITINNGYIVQQCYDDCINAGSTIDINGGFVYCYSTGNDAIDSNYSGNSSGTAISINGGIVFAMGTQSPEEGLDTDRGYIKVTGGYLFTAGGQQQSSPSISATQATAYIGSYSLSSGTYYTLVCGSTKIFTVRVPGSISQNYSIVSGTGMSTGSTCYLYSGSSAPTAYDSVWSDNSTERFWINPTVNTSSSVKSWTQSSLYTTSSSSSSGGGPGGRR